ncbi:MAG: hypothetical protein JW771_01200 [Candidatus Thermoplasmatota archaeon]|nr:hypothetical protein [Candidatus Thermoplasmatota archaeon]
MDNQIFLANEIGCSSFELKRTTKAYCWTIKVYHQDIQQSYNLVKDIDRQATQDYGATAFTVSEEANS